MIWNMFHLCGPASIACLAFWNLSQICQMILVLLQRILCHMTLNQQQGHLGYHLPAISGVSQMTRRNSILSMQRDSISCTNKDMVSKILPHTWWNLSIKRHISWKTCLFRSIGSKLKGQNTWIMTAIATFTAILLAMVEQITLNLWRPFSWIHGGRFVTRLNSNLITNLLPRNSHVIVIWMLHLRKLPALWNFGCCKNKMTHGGYLAPSTIAEKSKLWKLLHSCFNPQFQQMLLLMKQQCLLVQISSCVGQNQNLKAKSLLKSK